MIANPGIREGVEDQAVRAQQTLARYAFRHYRKYGPSHFASFRAPITRPRNSFNAASSLIQRTTTTRSCSQSM